MSASTAKKEYVIDASGKRLGHVATKIASILNGKNTTAFVKHIAPNVTVRVENASKLDIPEKRMDTKKYTRYSGHPGGLKTIKIEKMIKDKGYAEVIRKAVNGMIPKNKLRDKRMKNLIITE